ncbi:unnamed protein product [Angiostrongylus costaricensis]|uniref:Peptidase S1 domain-containing protein n=1 Tax=Angiostrongylus costaricensis TaxID=334426 RepID=A0A0R3PC55_ANGCS|nr:unnamed protein product [Angiostrongylus costaricensis]
MDDSMLKRIRVSNHFQNELPDLLVVETSKQMNFLGILRCSSEETLKITNEAVFVAVNLDFPHWQIEKELCSAVQISSQHLLTAAHCVVRIHENVKRCDTRIEKRLRYVPLLPSDLIIIAGSACPNLAEKRCWVRRNVYRAAEITVHPDHDPCQIKTDLAIVLVKSKISQRDGSSICMPSKNEVILEDVVAMGFGVKRLQWSMDCLFRLYELLVCSSAPQTNNKLRAVDLTARYQAGTRITATAKGKSICKGDSGGPLVKVNSTGSYVLLGIGSASKPPCDVKDRPEQGGRLREMIFVGRSSM